MTSDMLVPLLPLLIPAAMSIVMMVAIAIRRSHALTAGLAMLGLAGGLVAVPLTARVQPRQITALLTMDGYAMLFIALLLAAGFVVAVLAHGYLGRQSGRREELYVLVVISTVGAGALAAASHFAALFLGLEVLSITLYALLAYRRPGPLGLEAAIKYLVLAASSAAFLLFGLALLYAETGTMMLAAIGPSVAAGASPVALAGLALIVVGFGFKLAVVPFHLWSPDIYQGAPAPVAAFIATVSKGAMFALLLRYFAPVEASSFRLLFIIIAVASMLVGNLLALRQDNLKRLFAYSSISHFGYLLIAFLAFGNEAAPAVGFYLAAYFVTMLAAFGTMTELSTEERDADALEDYRGLFSRRPALAAVLTISMLSLAGIPLTAGFLGKFYVVSAGVHANAWLPVIVLVAGSAISLYYYVRVVITMFLKTDVPETTGPRASIPATVVLGCLVVILFWLGVYPEQLVALIRSAAGPVG